MIIKGELNFAIFIKQPDEIISSRDHGAFAKKCYCTSWISSSKFNKSRRFFLK